MTMWDKQVETAVKWIREICPEGELFSDSRDMMTTEKETVFFSYQKENAEKYISHAIQNGAKAIIYDDADIQWKPEWDVPALSVNGLKALAGPIAHLYYGKPSSFMHVVAVTGTNGKTSCTQWLGNAFSKLGKKTAVIGTLGIVIFEKGQAGEPELTGFTTPDQVQLQRKLAELLKAGVTCIAIEASSIGIEEGRLNGVDINTVLFTNFTRDHLDYHQSMTAYEVAKRRLFDWPGIQNVVMNLDDAKGKKWALEIQDKYPLMGYSIEHEREEVLPVLEASEIQAYMGGTRFLVKGQGKQSRIQTHLIGNFNVSNVLGVLGVLLMFGYDWKQATACLSTFMPPPGRMQLIGGKNTPLVVIDYAHTPDALEKGLETLRLVAQDRKGALWCVFGCGGNRDKGKRKEMGRVAESADHIIVTSDNPRNEEPLQIIEDIVSGMTDRPLVIEDRATAILQAVKQSSNEDVIFLAGKGHETYQEIKEVKHPFSDADHAALALATLGMMKEGKT